jgi:hypothetical protein
MTDEPGRTTERPASEVLAVAGDETRLAILRALFEAGGRAGYAELMDAVGVRDSGRFNYHLSRLVGPFVRKVEADTPPEAGGSDGRRTGGYELRHAGGQVVGAVLAGAYADERPVEAVPVDGDCRVCSGDLRARYEGDVATIDCADCGAVVTRDSVPPGVFEGYDATAFPAVLSRWVRHGFARAADGFCPVCAGRTDASLGTPEHDALGTVGVALACRRCGIRFTGSLGSLVLDHPAVVCFHYERGSDLRETPVWTLDWLWGDSAELVDSGDEADGDDNTGDDESGEDPGSDGNGRDPPAGPHPQVRARLTVECDGDRLVLGFDEGLSVVSVERRGE